MKYEQFEGHTPGPWEWDIDKYGYRGGIFRENYPTADVLEPLDYWVAISDADARLIAAAPDLLAENKRLRELVEAAYIEGCATGAKSANDHIYNSLTELWRGSESRAALQEVSDEPA